MYLELMIGISMLYWLVMKISTPPLHPQNNHKNRALFQCKTFSQMTSVIKQSFQSKNMNDVYPQPVCTVDHANQISYYKCHVCNQHKDYEDW